MNDLEFRVVKLGQFIDADPIPAGVFAAGHQELSNCQSWEFETPSWLVAVNHSSTVSSLIVWDVLFDTPNTARFPAL